MIKSIISILFKIALSLMFVSILALGGIIFALSFGKTEIEDKLNELVLENRLEIVEIVEKRLSLDFEYQSLIVSYKKHSIVNFKIQFSFRDVQMAQTNDPLPVYVDELNIEIDPIKSIINQIPAITAIIINGSEIQFSHNVENGYMINSIPITQFRLPKRKGFKRPSLELKSISAR